MTYQVVTLNELNEWTTDGCWGAEYARDFSENAARAACADLARLYPTRTWGIAIEKDNGDFYHAETVIEAVYTITDEDIEDTEYLRHIAVHGYDSPVSITVKD